VRLARLHVGLVPAGHLTTQNRRAEPRATAAEAALDGIYVLRTSVTSPGLKSGEVVSSYKALAQVERAFRAFNTDLDIRPIRHRTETRVRAHVFLRMISYYCLPSLRTSAWGRGCVTESVVVASVVLCAGLCFVGGVTVAMSG
jgi:hypothetical protein